jgi:peptidyl-tRNA hydrolase, PTH1 family
MPARQKILLTGLGNPGPKYKNNRHNIGFMIVDHIADRNNAEWRRNIHRDAVCETTLEDRQIILLKPQTFMNLSGRAVLPVLKKFNIDPSDMMVIHDDMDLAEGKVRLKVGGGDGGHRGVRSICDSLRFKDFIRVRLGIGRPPTGMNPEDYVLTDFTPEQKNMRGDLIERGLCAVKMVLSHGIEKAQNALHSSTPDLIQCNP